MLCIFLCCLLFLSVHSVSDQPILIIISYDAFRYNYFDKNATPFLSEIRKKGTTADYLVNVFPTKTFPNHHSIATGVYPEVHGVVGNEMYDPITKKKITILNPEMYNYNKNLLPIWTLNQMAGKNRRSASMMWPGGVFPYKNITPFYTESWNPQVSWYHRVDILISWITSKTNPANLVMFYIEEPDTHGHAYGPNSQIVYDLLEKLDDVSKYLYNKLEENKLLDKVNVIHLSDHGMVPVTPPRFINITQYLVPNSYVPSDTSPVLGIFPKDGYDINDMYERLKKASLENKNYNIYRRKELKERWHFRDNPRIPPLLAVAEPGYAFDDMDRLAKFYAKKYNFTLTDKSEFGVHGYDNEVRDMSPFFIAYGPRIKSSHKVPPFSTLDLYSLFCSILEIEPEKNNGTFANVRDILAPFKPATVSPFLIAVGGCVLSFSVIVFIVALNIITRRRRYRTDYPSAFGKILQNDKNTVEAQHLLESDEI